MAKKKRSNILTVSIVVVILIGVVYLSQFAKPQSFFEDPENYNVNEDLSSLGDNYIEVQLSDINGEKDEYGLGRDFVAQLERSFECTKSNGDDRESTIDSYYGSKSLRSEFIVPSYDSSKLKGMALLFKYAPSKTWNEDHPLTASLPELVSASLSSRTTSSLIFTIDPECQTELPFRYRSEFGLCEDYHTFRDQLEAIQTCVESEAEKGIKTQIEDHPGFQELSGQFILDEPLEPGTHVMGISSHLYQPLPGQVNLNNAVLRIYLDDGSEDSSGDQGDSNGNDGSSQSQGNDEVSASPIKTSSIVGYSIVGIILALVILLITVGRKKR